MKAKKTIVISAAALMGAVTFLTACGGNGGSADDKKENTIVGEWVSEEYNGSFIYTFKEDGSGNYDASGVQMPFTYTLEGDKLSITYEGDTDPFNTTYSIKDNKLTIKDSFDEDVVYDRK